MDRLKLENIPEELKSRPQWVLWKTVERNGKETKVPYSISGSEAASNDPTTWAAMPIVQDAYNRGGYDGIGYVFSYYDPYVGIDLDGCRDPETGKFADWGREIIVKLASYAEVSPSKTGAKVFCVGKSPFTEGKNLKLTGKVEAITALKEPGIELYDHARYFCVTGWRLAGLPHSLEKQDLHWLREKFWPAPRPIVPPIGSTDVVERARKYLARLPAAVSGQGGHNQTFHATCILVLGFGLGDDEAVGLLREYNARCQPPWSERELVHKITSAREQPGDRNYLRNALPESWSTIKIPDYGSAVSARRKTTLEDATKEYLQRLNADRMNLLSLGLKDIDYAIAGGVAPGEVVILAARPSHGKSALALQCIHSLTADNIPSIIISEEMSSLALAKRTIQFVSDVPEEHWKDRGEEVERHLDNHFEKRALCRIVESCGTAQAAAEEIRKAVKEDGVRLAAVDYAQLLRGKGKSRYEEITNTSILLRQVTNETNIVLLMLCQLNRQVEARPKFEPRLSDLRDSGQLEQDADVILFLVWPYRLDTHRNPRDYMVFVGKNRNRAINTPAITCEFDPLRQMVLPEAVRTTPKYAEFTPYADKDF